MANHWQQIHTSPADHIGSPGLEEAAYVAGWALSSATVLGVVLLIWHFNV
jgi:hypothetical protein